MDPPPRCADYHTVPGLVDIRLTWPQSGRWPPGTRPGLAWAGSRSGASQFRPPVAGVARDTRCAPGASPQKRAPLSGGTGSALCARCSKPGVLNGARSSPTARVDAHLRGLLEGARSICGPQRVARALGCGRLADSFAARTCPAKTAAVRSATRSGGLTRTRKVNSKLTLFR
jgi:hypothetical protein